jgi:hypothetical protein
VTLIAVTKGEVPKPALVAVVILMPTSVAVSFEALELLSHPDIPPFKLTLIVPLLIAPPIMAYAFWALLPAMRARIHPRVAGIAAWGMVLVACAATIPLGQTRHAAGQRAIAAQEKYDADLARLPPDAPLWEWVPFFDTRNESFKNDLLARVAKLDRRQADAELMLDRGDFPLSYIARLDLTPTPALCDKTRALLRRRIEPLVLKPGDSKPYNAIAEPVRQAAEAMEWLAGYECSVDAESVAWENMTKAYQGSDWDIHRLAEARDPKNFGHTVRFYPQRFSMLTPRAHLKAWLGFADQAEFRERALAGARALDHRTADAIEMLYDKNDIGAPWKILKYLPVLDLEANQRLCAAALFQIEGDLAKTLRPKADDPRPYDELLNRLGAYEPLTALIWLASHGCDADATLSEAEALIKTYRPSPSSGLMLGRLEQLHRKK